MFHPLLDLVLDQVAAEFRHPAPPWKPVRLSSTDRVRLEHECSAPSEFDPEHTRRSLLNREDTRLVTQQCVYGRVTAVLGPDQPDEIVPWSLWGRILRMYAGHTKAMFDVYFLAMDRPRHFPKRTTEPIRPIHINGGYTYPCSKKGVWSPILIYRLEDATRVLIHELQHACCLDHHENGVDRTEAETEAWAELWYVAFMSEGHPTRFYKGIQQQSDWIHIQNRTVRQWIGTTHAFPWRYTVGKEEVWRRWGILQPLSDTTKKEATQSLRLTDPTIA